MTTPMSLQPWWWQIFILIQLWPQFFQMFVYGDIVYAQTWYWPWKTVPSHIHMPLRPMLFEYGPHFLFDSFVKIWATCEMFLGKRFTAPPPPPGKKFPVRLWKFQTGIFVEWKAPNDFFTQETSTLNPLMFIFIVCKLLLRLKCLKHTET